VVEQTNLADTAMQGGKFFLVGLTGVGVNFTVLTISIFYLGISREIGLALAILISMSSNYLLNRIWTFESDNKIMTEYSQYILFNLLGVLIQYFVALGLEYYFQHINFEIINLYLINIPTIYLASFTGIGLGFVSNFMMSKFIVFRQDQ